MRWILSKGFALLAVALLALPVRASEGPLGYLDPLYFSVLAGTGAAGLSDGAHPTFMMPAGLVFDKSGDLYIADTAAERIRLRKPDGTVVTIAGSGTVNGSGVWVDGGFADGPAMSARFHRPEGLALGADGALYIADVGNHCIRKLYRGVVSTFAGVCGSPGALLGPRTTATFTAPRSIAIDRDGTMYVADTQVGVRRIDPNGVVAAVLPPTEVVRPTSVSLGYGHNRRVLFIATWRGIVRYNLDNWTSTLIQNYWNDKDPLPPLDSDPPLGNPFTIVALNDEEIVYTDLVNSSVKYLRDIRYVRNLGVAPPDMAPLWGGNATIGADGPRYNGPMSAAVAPDGRIVVADTGNRRLISINGLDRHHGYYIPEMDQMKFSRGDYRIVLIGGSYINYTTNYNQSMANIIGTELTKSGALRSTGLRPHAEYILPTSLFAERDFAEQALATDFDDVAVMFISAYDGDETYSVPNWEVPLNKDLIAIDKAFTAAGVPLIYVVLPRTQDLSPIEGLNFFEARANVDPDYFSVESKLLKAFNGVKAPIINVFPIMRAYELNTNQGPLYTTNDGHLTPFGRKMIGEYVARQIELIKPWKNLENKTK